MKNINNLFRIVRQQFWPCLFICFHFHCPREVHFHVSPICLKPYLIIWPLAELALVPPLLAGSSSPSLTFWSFLLPIIFESHLLSWTYILLCRFNVVLWIFKKLIYDLNKICSLVTWYYRVKNQKLYLNYFLIHNLYLFIIYILK